MDSEELRRKFGTIAILLLVLLAPLVIVGTALTFLVLTGDLVRGEVSPIEFLELYAIEFVLVAVFTFGLFQLTQHLAHEKLPDRPTEIDARDDEREATGSTPDKD